MATTTSTMVSRARYALPRGVPALQVDPLRQRCLVGGVVAVTCLAGAGAGYWVGAGTRAEVRHMPAERGVVREWVTALSRGPWDLLLQNQDLFLDRVPEVVDAPELWSGVQRLCEAALLDGSADGRRRAGRLAALLAQADAPAELRRLRGDLLRHERLMDAAKPR
jgi:hypothetical protein